MTYNRIIDTYWEVMRIHGQRRRKEIYKEGN